MKKSESFTATGNTVPSALAKGVCPICSLVRAFQNELIERLEPNWASTVCNYHAWAIAASAPAASVAEIFLAMLRDASVGEVWKERIDCDLCWSIHEHEIAWLREFAREMQRAKFAEWVGQYGTLCRFHGATLRPMLSEEHAQIIAKVIENNRQQLEELLESFAAKARNGGHSGGGILGRAAEFLVAQRGLTR
jgi:uncharacterized protein YdhG (YjbR/CyaY superfamily)